MHPSCTLPCIENQKNAHPTTCFIFIYFVGVLKYGEKLSLVFDACMHVCKVCLKAWATYV